MKVKTMYYNFACTTATYFIDKPNDRASRVRNSQNTEEAPTAFRASMVVVDLIMAAQQCTSQGSMAGLCVN